MFTGMAGLLITVLSSILLMYSLGLLGRSVEEEVTYDVELQLKGCKDADNIWIWTQPQFLEEMNVGAYLFINEGGIGRLNPHGDRMQIWPKQPLIDYANGCEEVVIRSTGSYHSLNYFKKTRCIKSRAASLIP